MQRLELENQAEVLPVFEASPEASEIVQTVINSIELDARDCGYAKFMQRLNDSIGHSRETGVRFSVLTNSSEVNSDTDAIIIPGPFATKIESFLVLAEMIRRIGEASGLRDKKGRVLPVVSVSAPVAESTVKLNSQQKTQVAAGDFRPIAEKYLETIKEFMPGLEAAAFMGVSLGASLGVVFANVAARSGVDVKGLVMGVPGNMPHRRPLRELVPVFIGEAKASDRYLASRKGIFGEPEIAGVAGLVRQAPMNTRLIAGLSAGQFFSCLNEFSLKYDIPISMFLSDGDTIAPTEVGRRGLSKMPPGRVSASTWPTAERHGVVYCEEVLGLAISEALRTIAE